MRNFSGTLFFAAAVIPSQIFLPQSNFGNLNVFEELYSHCYYHGSFCFEVLKLQYIME